MRKPTNNWRFIYNINVSFTCFAIPHLYNSHNTTIVLRCKQGVSWEGGGGGGEVQIANTLVSDVLHKTLSCPFFYLSFLVSRSCEPYSAGELCEPYLKGQQIYVNLERGSQARLSVKVELQYGLLKKYVSPGCKDYVLPTLCNYVFPPCDLPYTDPKPRRFCRDDCMILQNNFCRVEFERARSIKAIQHLLPDCSSMPSEGAPGYNTCIRVIPPGM